MYLPSLLHFLNLASRAEPVVQASTGIGRRATSTSTVPKVSSVKELGTAYDPNFPDVYRDNGGGGTINGVNLIVFSDTGVTDGGPLGNLTWFVSNTVAALNYNDPKNPLNLFDFGSNGKPSEFVPRQANESDTSKYAIWPNSNIMPLSTAGQGIAVYPIILRDPSIGGGNAVYNTMVKITTTQYGPVATRLVPQLFYGNELRYGEFGMVKGVNGDGYVYLFASVSSTSSGVGVGIKVARVTEANVANRKKYTYWNGATWAAKPPLAADAKANMLNFTGSFGYGPVSGDIYYNTYYNCWMAIFFDAFVDGVFRMMYTTTSALVGAWTAPEVDIFTTPAADGYYNYAGHAYPNLGSGKSLLLSWTYGFNLTKMANVTFA